MVYVKASDELSVAPFGTPISFHVPSEACITIHHNGSTKGKKDYIILFDGEGNFLKSTKDFEFYQSIAKQNNSIANKNKNGSENSLIASLRQVQEGKECDFDMSEFVDLASSMVIKQYMKSIISGKEDNISITLDEETNKIFLTRLFKRQKSYLPASKPSKKVSASTKSSLSKSEKRSLTSSIFCSSVRKLISSVSVRWRHVLS